MLQFEPTSGGNRKHVTIWSSAELDAALGEQVGTSLEAQGWYPTRVGDVRSADVLCVGESIPEVVALRDRPALVVTVGGAEAVGQWLRAGAEDVVRFPFDAHELSVRIARVLRKSAVLLSIGGLEIDAVSRCIRLAGVELPMTAREVSLLLYLGRNQGRWVSNAELRANVNGTERGDASSPRVHVCHIRQKLREHRWIIQSKHGFGYRLANAPREARETAPPASD